MNILVVILISYRICHLHLSFDLLIYCYFFNFHLLIVCICNVSSESFMCPFNATIGIHTIQIKNYHYYYIIVNLTCVINLTYGLNVTLWPSTLPRIVP